MKDTLETNLPEEAGKLEETKKPVETPEIDATANVEANDTAEADAAIAAGKLTKEEILAKLTELVETSVETSRGEVEALKQAYYKIRRNESSKFSVSTAWRSWVSRALRWRWRLSFSRSSPWTRLSSRALLG